MIDIRLRRSYFLFGHATRDQAVAKEAADHAANTGNQPFFGRLFFKKVASCLYCAAATMASADWRASMAGSVSAGFILSARS